MANGVSHEERAKCLKCVIYECAVLARSILGLRQTADGSLAEVYKTAGVLKLRSLYDFLHRPTASDTIKWSLFDVYAPTIPAAMGRQWDTWLEHDSINCYFVHLDRRRITKTVPQPKFESGETAVINTAIQLLDQAMAFAASVIQHQDFSGLDTYGGRYWTDFQATLAELHQGQMAH